MNWYQGVGQTSPVCVHVIQKAWPCTLLLSLILDLIEQIAYTPFNKCQNLDIPNVDSREFIYFLEFLKFLNSFFTDF